LQAKDYYKILGLPPSASLKEIKSAYRSLAHQFHPDKNGNDPYAAAQFEIIKEAYEILSNPVKKEYYLQQRWYDQVMNKKQSTTVVTPVSILKQFLELDRYVSRLDIHRMDTTGLYDYICHVLSGDTINKLNVFDEKDVNRSIVDSVLKTGSVLPWIYARPVAVTLMKLQTDPITLEKIRDFLQHSKKAHAWSKYKVWMLLLIVLAICCLIYVIGS